MASDERACPYCAEMIKSAAVKCKHCGEFLDGAAPQAVLADDERPCPACGITIKAAAVKCKHCYALVGADDAPRQARGKPVARPSAAVKETKPGVAARASTPTSSESKGAAAPVGARPWYREPRMLALGGAAVAVAIIAVLVLGGGGGDDGPRAFTAADKQYLQEANDICRVLNGGLSAFFEEADSRLASGEDDPARVLRVVGDASVDQAERYFARIKDLDGPDSLKGEVDAVADEYLAIWDDVDKDPAIAFGPGSDDDLFLETEEHARSVGLKDCPLSTFKLGGA